ncbi:histidine kinase, partial [Staphylococcus saprophyticus]|uniref:histidine kinase n=1 Tax=Staphylococcus saprophyticus TaxID=29385 RepID=UPI003704763A
DSEKGGELVLEVSEFLRCNLEGAGNKRICLEKELEEVEWYLCVEEARYAEGLNVWFDIDGTC